MNGAILIAARGETAHKLQDALTVMKLATLLDKHIFPDRESALASWPLDTVRATVDEK